MKEEDILLKKLGKENSFKVPDGYFENLTSEVMNKLPEKEKVAFKEEPVSTWTRLKPLLYICLLYTSDAADDLLCGDLGGCRIIKKKKQIKTHELDTQTRGTETSMQAIQCREHVRQET